MAVAAPMEQALSAVVLRVVAFQAEARLVEARVGKVAPAVAT